MHAIVLSSLGPQGAKVDFDRVYETAACDYTERGEPSDLLADLKKRARGAIPEHSTIPSVEETRRREEEFMRTYVPMTPEQKAAAKEKMRAILAALPRR